MRISDWSSDVCSSDLGRAAAAERSGERWNLQEKEEAERVKGQCLDSGHADVIIFRDGGDDRLARLGQKQCQHERENDQHQIVDARPKPGKEIAARGLEQKGGNKKRTDKRKKPERKQAERTDDEADGRAKQRDRKSTRLNSSH